MSIDLKDLISTGKLEEAIHVLKHETAGKSKQLQKAAAMISQRYETWREEEMLGTSQESKVERNRICEAVLEFWGKYKSEWIEEVGEEENAKEAKAGRLWLRVLVVLVPLLILGYLIYDLGGWGTDEKPESNGLISHPSKNLSQKGYKVLTRRDVVDLSHRRSAPVELLKEHRLYAVDWAIEFTLQKDDPDLAVLSMSFPVFGSEMEMICLSHPKAEISSVDGGRVGLEVDVSGVPLAEPFKLELLQRHYNGFQGMPREHVSFEFPKSCGDFACKIYWPHDMDPAKEGYSFFKYQLNDKRGQAYPEPKVNYNPRKRDSDWHIKNAMGGYRYEVEWEWRRYDHLQHDHPRSFFERGFVQTR